MSSDASSAAAPPTRRATTILLLRPADTASGMEVFMLQRHRRSGFLPNAWVFPGGRVDARDALADNPRLTGGSSALSHMTSAVPGLSEADAVSFLVAGIRETFEEAGLWLGSGSLPQDQRQPLNDGEVALADLLEAHDATVDLDRIHPWSWWITPEAEPKRYDTRFFVARADRSDGTGRHDEVETVDSRWVCPAWGIEHSALDDFPMAPPTWWTLRELAALGSVDAALAAVPERSNRPIQPVMKFEAGGMRLLLPGHPDHPDPGIEGLPPEIGFAEQRWVIRA